MDYLIFKDSLVVFLLLFSIIVKEHTLNDFNYLEFLSLVLWYSMSPSSTFYYLKRLCILQLWDLVVL